MANPTDCDLVLEGGGVKGIALVGALAVLEERGCTFHRVAGTSAGSIVGALVASGMTAKRMYEIMQDLNYRRFEDETRWLRLLGPIGKAAAILLWGGICKGEELRSWLTEMLCDGDEPINTFGDVALEDAGASAKPGERSRLVVMASDISNGRLARLPWDYDRYGVDADEVLIADAVRASMSIPFFYRPASLAASGLNSKIRLVDGGMLSNFPVAVFDRADRAEPRWPTFGIKLSARPATTATAANSIGGVFTLTRAMIATMTGFYDRMHVGDESVIDRTIFIDTFGVRATDFDLDHDTAERLYQQGRAAAEKFLDGGDGHDAWNFEAYKAKYRAA